MNAARTAVLTASLLLVLPAFAQQVRIPRQRPVARATEERRGRLPHVGRTTNRIRPCQAAAAGGSRHAADHRDRHDAGRRCSWCGARRGSGRSRWGRCAHGRRGGRGCRPWPEPPAKCGRRPARAAANASRQPAATTGLRQSPRRMPRGQGLQRQIKQGLRQVANATCRPGGC